MTTGSVSAQPELARTLQTPQFDGLICFALLLSSHCCPCISQALYIAVATVQQQSRIKLNPLGRRRTVLLRVYVYMPQFLTF